LHTTRVLHTASLVRLLICVPRRNLKVILISITNPGEEIKLKPYSGALNIDFGKGIRKKNVYLL